MSRASRAWRLGPVRVERVRLTLPSGRDWEVWAMYLRRRQVATVVTAPHEPSFSERNGYTPMPRVVRLGRRDLVIER